MKRKIMKSASGLKAIRWKGTNMRVTWLLIRKKIRLQDDGTFLWAEKKIVILNSVFGEQDLQKWKENKDIWGNRAEWIHHHLELT